MNRINQFSKLMVSAAVLIVAVAALIFVLKFGGARAQATGVAPQGFNGREGRFFTQSQDGKTLYMWSWDYKTRQLRRSENTNSW
jgi:hypothetical protein